MTLLPLSRKRRAWWPSAFLLAGGLLCGAASVIRGQELQPQAFLFAGRLLTVNQDGLGAYHRGEDLWTLRLVGALPLPGGLRFGARGDLTSLTAISPEAIDVTSIRTAEGYGALSWSRRLAGFDVGPAAMLGAVVPVEGALDWRFQSTWGGGARIGHGRSWLYLLAGQDGASDEAAGRGTSPALRLILAGSIEFGRFALAGDACSGVGGRVRVGALVRLPLPGGGQ